MHDSNEVQNELLKEAMRIQYFWQFVAQHLGLYRDTIIEIKYENKTLANQATAMLKAALKRYQSMANLKSQLGSWGISEEGLKHIAKQIPDQYLKELAEAVCLETDNPSSKCDSMLALLTLMKKNQLLGANCYTWNIINQFIAKGEKKNAVPVEQNAGNSDEQIQQLKLDLQLADQREAELQFQVKRLKTDPQAHVEMDDLRKSIQTLQETVDTLIIQIQYVTPPENPQARYNDKQYSPTFLRRSGY